MKISLLLAGLVCVLLLSACASKPARGGSVDSALCAPSTAEQLTQQSNGQPNYPEILSGPGWF